MKTFKTFIAEEHESTITIPGAVTDLEHALHAVVNAADVAQTAHWNVRSITFIALHPWLGEVYESLLTIADGIAEQIKIKNIDNIVTAVHQLCPIFTNDKLVLSYLQLNLEGAIELIEIAAKNPIHDGPTKNLLEGWQGEVQKMRWFIEASLKE